MPLLLIALGGALGSVARYLAAGAVHRVAPPFFPYGTFVVNVTGCLVFGLLAGLAHERAMIGETRNPLRAYSIAGSKRRSKSSLPNFADSSTHADTAPGTVTEFHPVSGTCLK